MAMIGNFLALASGLATTATIILIRHEEKIVPVDQVMFWPLAFAAICFMPLAWMDGGAIVVSQTVVMPLLALGIITAFARYSYSYALKYIEAHITAILGMATEVILSIFLAFVFLGEGLGLNTFVGGALILAAGLSVQFELNAKTKISAN